MSGLWDCLPAFLALGLPRIGQFSMEQVNIGEEYRGRLKKMACQGRTLSHKKLRGV